VGGHGIHDHPQRESDEVCGISLPGSLLQNLIIYCLVFEDQAFHWDVGEQRVPAGQNQALSQPSHTAVAVCEGVNKLES
jgi:hypothetical protein